MGKGTKRKVTGDLWAYNTQYYSWLPAGLAPKVAVVGSEFWFVRTSSTSQQSCESREQATAPAAWGCRYKYVTLPNSLEKEVPRQ